MEMLNAIKEFKPSIKVNIESEDYERFFYSGQSMLKINRALLMDHPELIHYGYATIASTNDKNTLDIRFTYAISDKEMYKRALDEVKTVLDDAKIKTSNMNEYEKAKYVYDWLARHNTYGNVDNPMNQSAYSAINAGESPVCAGYAKASQLMFQAVGLNSLLVTGLLDNGGHEWNVVQIDNKFYNYDVTISSTGKGITNGGIIYAGFLFSNEDGYDIDYSSMVPKRNGKKYLYYKYNDLTYKYSSNKLYKLKELLNNTNNNYIEVEVTNAANMLKETNYIKNKLGASKLEFINNIAIIVK